MNREFDYFKAWVPKSVLTVKRGKFLNLGERYSNLLRSRKECIVKARAGGREKAREFPRLQVVVQMGAGGHPSMGEIIPGSGGSGRGGGSLWHQN